MKTELWQRKAGQNANGGLGAGRKQYNRDHGAHLRAPTKVASNGRHHSFCKRMCGMKAKLTSAKHAHDPDSRVNKALRAWGCKCSGH